MKEAIDKDEIPEKKSELSHSKFDHLCTNCYRKKRNITDIKLKEDHSHTTQLQQGFPSNVISKEEELKDSFEEDDDQDSECFSLDPESEQETTIHRLPSFLQMPQVTRRQFNFQQFVLKPLEDSRVKIQEDSRVDSDGEEEEVRMSLKRGFPEIIPIIKDKCNLCNRKTGLLGFDCGYCSKNFCKVHRLPQTHECQKDYRGKCYKKLVKELKDSIIKKQHKGKLQQI